MKIYEVKERDEVCIVTLLDIWENNCIYGCRE